MSLPSSAPPPVVVPDIPAAPLPPADLAIMDQPMLDGPEGPDEDSVAPTWMTAGACKWLGDLASTCSTEHLT